MMGYLHLLSGGKIVTPDLKFSGAAGREEDRLPISRPTGNVVFVLAGLRRNHVQIAAISIDEVDAAVGGASTVKSDPHALRRPSRTAGQTVERC